ncbi:hypothetical protein C8C83_4259 [Flavobacterium sp. 90]|nr:hypothetical protein C8C82_4593 [Flavobacterium sp. 81]TCK56247.1 hypothetical protein C8C83_4259 [Flavobacterium sp. 90]
MKKGEVDKVKVEMDSLLVMNFELLVMNEMRVT